MVQGSVTLPPQRPPAQLLWPAGEDRRLLSKVVRVERILVEVTRRRIPLQSLSWAVGRSPRWLSDKLGLGKLDGYRNFSDAILATLEAELENPAATFPLDHRGLHYTRRPRRADGTFGHDDDDPKP